jgi:uncharacterized DUF497 family protein
MMPVKFEWDEKKNEINIRKHGVSFDDAKSCFEDDFAEIFEDQDHSINEDRFKIYSAGHVVIIKNIGCDIYRKESLDKVGNLQ